MCDPHEKRAREWLKMLVVTAARESNIDNRKIAMKTKTVGWGSEDALTRLTLRELVSSVRSDPVRCVNGLGVAHAGFYERMCL